MKNSIFMIAFLSMLCVSFSSLGQNRRGTPEDRAKRQTEMLTKQLTLTDEQVPKVQAIMLDFNNELQKAFENQSGDGPMMPDPKIFEKRNDELKKVLTTEQYEKFMKLPMAKGMRPPRPRDGGAPGGNPDGPGGMPGGPEGPGF